MPDLHPQDWLTIIEGLPLYDQWRVRFDERARGIFEQQQEIAAEHGYDILTEFVRRGVC
jgi:hypothetical protein